LKKKGAEAVFLATGKHLCHIDKSKFSEPLSDHWGISFASPAPPMSLLFLSHTYNTGIYWGQVLS
jgi:hypothetical protein